jgi:hypothetical protein
MSGSSWDQHTQEVVAEGELIPNMKIVSKGKSPDGVLTFTLECPDCGTTFNSVISNDSGKAANCECVTNAETNTPELVAKCPACGCMWDGNVRQYFSVCVLSDDIQFTDQGPAFQSQGSANIIDAVEACDAKLALTLAEETLTSEVLKDSGGCLITKIGRFDARAIWRQKRWRQAHDNKSSTASDILQLQFDLEREEKADNAVRQERMKLGQQYAIRNGTPYNGPQSKPGLDIFRMMAGIAAQIANRNNQNQNEDTDNSELPSFGDRSMTN